MYLLGTLVGGQLNRGIYRLAWNQRPWGPWSAPHPDAPRRTWYDKIPVFGWVALRRESLVHGRGYWIRPLLLELFCGAWFAFLYWWEISGHVVPRVAGLVMPSSLSLHAQLFCHLVLISFMVMATFIDIDEKTIPDQITVPGLLIGLVLVTLLPSAPLWVPRSLGGTTVTSLSITTPHAWPRWLDGPGGLAVGLACFAGWIYGILPKTWWTRSGWGKAFRYLGASIVRHPVTPRLVLLGLAGWAGIGLVWYGAPSRWQALLSALVGALFGGGIFWSVRVVAGRVLEREAIGFGDVTLMAMIGAFVGWQPSLIIFFLAPLSGLAIALAQWLVTRRKDIAYGPFLCLSTVILIVYWPSFWQRLGYVFELGRLVPVLFAACLLLLAILLWMWNHLVHAFLPKTKGT
jgi:prepilin signal peptidase PulO-like enzyme (type II secretory pathway)